MCLQGDTWDDGSGSGYDFDRDITSDDEDEREDESSGGSLVTGWSLIYEPISVKEESPAEAVSAHQIF